MRKMVVLRRVSQTFFLIAFIVILWSTTYPLHSEISPRLLFNLDPLITFITALSERVLVPGIIVSLAMVVLTLLLGRFFCGWVCPLGTLIDWVGKFSPDRRKRLKPEARRVLAFPKFAILAVIALMAFWGVQAAWVLDPVVTVARVVSLNIIPTVTLGVDRAFQFAIQKFNLYGDVYDFYRSLKEGLLGVNVHFFANALVTLGFFLLILAGTFLVLRLWCRMLCPLGAWYALNAAPAVLERKVGKCSGCGQCVQKCPMGAIEDGATYKKGECILCMDCLYTCPERGVSFGWREDEAASVKTSRADDRGITRGQFLFLVGAIIPFLKTRLSFAASPDGKETHPVIRPPGALSEDKFVNRCVRCGNCMKVCITNGLQPAVSGVGPEGIWTPELVPEIGYCEYNCTLCGEVCPTGAIAKLPLAEKRKARLGLAVIDRARCYAWGGQKECMVCEEHCPVAEKAIKIREIEFQDKTMRRPVVEAARCIGCGICQNKCPVSPVRAIRVDPTRQG